MKAGFARVCVNPPLGGMLEGLSLKIPAVSVHDDLYVRALYLTHEGKDVLIIGCDLLFFERSDIDRFKGAIGRRLSLAPSQIMLNVSHNHAGPRLTRWAYGGPADPLYIEQVERALIDAATNAAGNLREVEIHSGMTHTKVPVSRRHLDAKGEIQWRPYFAGRICDALPVTILKERNGSVVSVMFSVSCHPSIWYEPEYSADFPGVAQRLLNEHFNTQGAIFLQGAAGDTKPRQVADGETRWRHGKWEDVEAAGKEIADEIIALARGGLTRQEPEIRWHYEEMHWPMAPLPSREDLLVEQTGNGKYKTPIATAWATEMIARLDRFGKLPQSVPVGLHAVQIAKGVRLIGLEGEAVAELGLITLKVYDRGITFPLGYTNGTQLYLTVSRMSKEGGYEFDSFYEYHWPAPLAPGGGELLEETLRRLQGSGKIPN
ncbi:MAG: hypothetical protein IT444_06445 [Phycisphaeraceae bacterium]|nr:hypothetical protein [Phycisphaeraceae bacterium]